MHTLTPHQLYARLYDLYVTGWAGELDFYRRFARSSLVQAHGLLEVACGTGRVAIPLARDGTTVTGLDLSPELLSVARRKSRDLTNLTWVEGDMRNFDLSGSSGRLTFGGAIIPGHSFQFMLTPADQLRCLERIQSHLVPGGEMVIHLDHQDLAWLGGLYTAGDAKIESGSPITDPETGQTFRQATRWAYAPSTQTATVFVDWQQIGPAGEIVRIWTMDPMPLHCVFRFEMEHLLARAGFEVEAVYGDFYGNELMDGSESMVWLARNRCA